MIDLISIEFLCKFEKRIIALSKIAIVVMKKAQHTQIPDIIMHYMF